METRLIIADDHPIVIQGIKDVLSKRKEIHVVATFSDGRLLLQSPMLANADVLLLDLNMPNIDGLQVLDELKRLHLTLKIIVVTSYLSPQLAEQCKDAGAAGYLIKSEDLHQLVKNIDDVLSGKLVFPDFSRSEQRTVNDFSYFDEFLKKYKLTKREVEIIRMVCNDYNSKEIADRLYLSTFTVQTHRRNIVKKLGLDDSRISLYRFAKDNGVI
ncbi:DNA-binding response regulator [Parapedobacter pyrenivorans]|uniref:DNA-binding response regulator n=1 Tax=Parapedobacter pyrenivorans TaxID=1305674 RepID=A0A917I317_9SPHI|nr:response regulator transcription factor [Parapedobacter pyrenivorans]GGH04842.1 DNA-binding response regulator [Parapedobacter pyrenivorans]